MFIYYNDLSSFVIKAFAVLINYFANENDKIKTVVKFVNWIKIDESLIRV